MGLNTKNMYEVLKNLIDWTTIKTDKITDFNVGSAIRTLYEAVAIQFEEFYFAMKQNVIYAIDHAIYEAFDFYTEPSQKAKGVVTVYFEESLPATLTFPKGTVFCTSDIYGTIYYESTEEVDAEQGLLSIDIEVECTEGGIKGNVPDHAITTIVASNAIIRKVTNQKAFTSGKEAETLAERKKRFQHYIKTLARGTADAILYGTLDVEGVSGAYIDDNYIGYVVVYAHNSDGELPETLRENILKNLEDYRAAGIEVEVLPIIKKAIDVKVEIVIENDYNPEVYANNLKNILVGKMNEYTVGNDFYVADVIHMMKSAYDEIINVKVVGGKDIILQKNELIRPGIIEVTCIKFQDWRA